MTRCLSTKPKRIFLVLLTLSLSVASAFGGDQTVPVLEAQTAILDQAAAAQVRIDDLDGQTRALLEEFRQGSRELEGLQAYNDHLERMVAAQQASIASLEGQVDGVEVTQREIVPLMARMVAALDQFVELDLPFQLDERRARVAALAAALDSPDSSPGETYRRILETYRAEIDAGRGIEAYRGVLSAEGRERTVDFLRVGRVTLIYRTLDGRESGVWDRAAKRWIGLPDTDRSDLSKAFRVAEKQSAPALLTLPGPAPEVLP
ncbi:DUF3450 domain-containing protein [Thiocystis violacea]|uniref:DUF3450 domain-containing protein n=1 Tax=Thiocystis violacea TaxID=13725 RepID=UPI001907E97A|nr:DUF3450 domain-containing protein [Thiocystis violacea]MBK1720756.1 hypothetical protein [Thiocystis violacea]